MLNLREWRLREFGEAPVSGQQVQQAPVSGQQAPVSGQQAPVSGSNPQEEAEVEAAKPEIEDILHNTQLAALLQKVFAKFKNISRGRKKILLQIVIEKLMNPDKGAGLNKANVFQTAHNAGNN